jgi:hypothetical protein
MTPLVDHIAADRLYGDHDTVAVALGRSNLQEVET